MALRKQTIEPEFVEQKSVFSISAEGSWEVSSLPVPPNSVVELSIVNKDVGNVIRVGARKAGSSLNRKFNVRESDTITVSVSTDSSSSIELFTNNLSETTFRLLGYWR